VAKTSFHSFLPPALHWIFLNTFSQNCDFISRNSDFISRNCEIKSHIYLFIFSQWRKQVSIRQGIECAVLWEKTVSDDSFWNVDCSKMADESSNVAYLCAVIPEMIENAYTTNDSMQAWPFSLHLFWVWSQDWRWRTVPETRDKSQHALTLLLRLGQSSSINLNSAYSRTPLSESPSPQHTHITCVHSCRATFIYPTLSLTDPHNNSIISDWSRFQIHHVCFKICFNGILWNSCERYV